MTPTSSKQIHTLITLYITLYTGKYGQAPRVNRYRDKWGFQSMIDDLGYEGAEKVVRFYFTTNRVGHPVSKLLSNYDRLSMIMEEFDQDEIRRAELRAETELRVRDWEEKSGN